MQPKLNWTGEEVYKAVQMAGVKALTEFGLRHETASRSVVSPGRGVLTGTYRRSIHSAGSGYNFGNDNVRPSSSSPDRSGKGGDATIQGHKIAVTVGSGMVYAGYLEKLYAPIKTGHKRVISMLPSILQKHVKQQGIK